LQRDGGYVTLCRRDEIGLKLGARQPGMFALRLDETLLAVVMRNPERCASHVVLPSGESWRALLAGTNSDHRSALVLGTMEEARRLEAAPAWLRDRVDLHARQPPLACHRYRSRMDRALSFPRQLHGTLGTLCRHGGQTTPVLARDGVDLD
jgi:hypothetical protein